MNIKLLRPFLLFVCLSFFLSSINAQNSKKDIKQANEQKEFLLKFMKQLNGYINEPDSFAQNKEEILLYFDKKNSKAVYNFTSPKKKKNTLSSIQFIDEINANFPEGFGLSYEEDKFEFIKKKNNIISKTYVFKAPVEYSGFRKDGSLMSYAEDQYFYIKKGLKKSSISRISNINYYKMRFKKQVFRQALLVEPFFPVYAMTQGSFEYSDNDYEYYSSETIDYYSSNESYNSNLFLKGTNGVNLVYMFKSGFGLGVGFTNYSYTTLYRIMYRGYELPQSLGYIPTLYTTIDSDVDKLDHKIEASGFSMPFFMRAQVGDRYFSVSFDLGIGVVFKPRYDSYLTGKIAVFGVDSETGETNTNFPQQGFGTFTYDNTLVKSIKSEVNSKYFLARLNMQIQPVKYAYLRLSSGIMGTDIVYENSWHKYDMHAIKLPNAMEKKRLMTFFTEFSIGLNLNEIALGFF